MILPKGTFIVGNKLMAQCGNCGKIVRIDKPLFGGLHICSDPYHVEKYGNIVTGWIKLEKEKE